MSFTLLYFLQVPESGDGVWLDDKLLRVSVAYQANEGCWDQFLVLEVRCRQLVPGASVLAETEAEGPTAQPCMGIRNFRLKAQLRHELIWRPWEVTDLDELDLLKTSEDFFSFLLAVPGQNPGSHIQELCFIAKLHLWLLKVG